MSGGAAAGKDVLAGKPVAPPSPALSEVAKYRMQIAAVEAVVRIADGDHLVEQQRILGKLQTSLATARAQAQAAKDPVVRARELRRQLEEIEAKAKSNKLRAEAARAEMERYAAYADTQSTKASCLRQELLALAPPPPTAAQGEAELLLQLAHLQRQLDQFRAITPSLSETGQSREDLSHTLPRSRTVDEMLGERQGRRARSESPDRKQAQLSNRWACLDRPF